MSEKDCPLDCPNRQQKQLGKGYSYGLAFILTLFLAGQSVRLKANNDGWEASLEPVPMSVYVPGIAIIASVLGFDTDRLAAAFGALLTKGEKD